MADEKFDWQEQIAKNQELYKLQLMREQNSLLSEIAGRKEPVRTGRVSWLAVFMFFVVAFVIGGSFFIVHLQNSSPYPTFQEEAIPEPVVTDNPGTGYTTYRTWLKALWSCGYKTTNLKRYGDGYYNYKPTAKPKSGQFYIEYSERLASLDLPKASAKDVNCISQRLYGINASKIEMYDVISIDGGFGIWHGISSGPPEYTFTFQK
jgi:hypothetical protein